MRDALAKLNSKKTTIFVGKIRNIQYQRLLVTDIKIYDESGEKVIGEIDHCLLSKKQFKSMPKGSMVRFTGKPKMYTRADGSKDYQIIVNKARKI